MRTSCPAALAAFTCCRRSPPAVGEGHGGHGGGCRSTTCRHSAREFTPSTFRYPPQNPASGQNDAYQYQPSVNPGRDEATTKRNDRRDHREIKWAGIAAVGTCAPFCIRNTRRSHRAQGNDPNSCSNRDSREQAGDNGSPRDPPGREGSFAGVAANRASFERYCAS
jgi:hypothetical protein